MNDQDALQAIAVVDRLRLEAARAAVALEGLEAAMLNRGAAMVTVGKVLGVPGAVRRWCSEQAAILEAGTDQQQAIFRELVTVAGDGSETMRRDTAADRSGVPLDTIEAADPVIELLRTECWR